MLEMFWLSYLQEKTVVDPGEDGRVVVDIDDSDGDEDCRGQRRIPFICCLHRQRVMRDLERRKRWNSLFFVFYLILIVQFTFVLLLFFLAFEKLIFICAFFSLLILTYLTHTDLFPVQRSADSDFSTTRVNRELLQTISAHYGVTQQIVDGTVLISGCYLEVKKGRGRKVRRGIILLALVGISEVRQKSDKRFTHYTDSTQKIQSNRATTTPNDNKVRTEVMLSTAPLLGAPIV